MDSSITVKIDKISCGLWDQNIPIIIVMKNISNLDTLLENSYYRRHSNIRIISAKTKNVVDQVQFNVWSQEWEHSVVNIKRNNQKLIPGHKFDFLGYQAKHTLSIQHSKIPIQIKLTFVPSNILNVNYFTDEDGSVGLYGKMNRVSHLLAQSLRASFSLDPPPDRQWGAIDHRGECKILKIFYHLILGDGEEYWNGMMGLLHQDKVDAAVGTIFYVKDRVSISEPHIPIENIYSTYVVPKYEINNFAMNSVFIVQRSHSAQVDSNHQTFQLQCLDSNRRIIPGGDPCNLLHDDEEQGDEPQLSLQDHHLLHHPHHVEPGHHSHQHQENTHEQKQARSLLTTK